MTREIAEMKALWKDLMTPVYRWFELPDGDEKWADWSAMFLVGIIIVDLVVM
ncbi:hypothetical protein RIN67_02965 [Levilactobacillus namurensis]|uniref:hypothetical protein n=1 Tax=Levilactobacillus namurensis TaxID=380393 RepID=UPI0004B0D6DB|nr:hypothetical protein [Levilactobacillus namurensis]MDT7019330.1 hypothetical protein [Levilactobacillus namurensis]WNN66070.1 hypothetical protein RIN67_02965 [Levilactobacillus namurensis]